MMYPSANLAWLQALSMIFESGSKVSPRGKLTLEIPQSTFVSDMLKPVVKAENRKLNYKFMAAEAFWILDGDNRVESIKDFNPNIAQFSDDGVVFAGAYGPMIESQFSYVVEKITEDKDSRQAGLTIWKPNPEPSKDIPCTVAIFFQVRNHKLNCHVFMRSSDVWLGLPYDVFTFSMLATKVCARLNGQGFGKDIGKLLQPGNLFLTAASSHIYEQHFQAAKNIIESRSFFDEYDSPNTPEKMYTDEAFLMNALDVLRFTSPGDALRWWEN
jgi:thymidylate synthase